MVSYYISFVIFPLLLHFLMAPKVPGLTKYTFQQESLPYQKKISVQSGKNLLDVSYCTLWMTFQCALQCSLILSITIQALTLWFHFFWFLYIEKHNVKRGRGKSYIHQINKFKQKGKHKIECYSKFLMIFAA